MANLGQLLEYALLRLALGVLGRLPLASFAPLARMLSWLFNTLLPFGRRAVTENLAIAFPEMTLRQRKQMLRETYRHTILLLLETARLPHASPHEIDHCLENTDELETVHKLSKRPDGFVFMTAHVGSWEWLGAWYSRRFSPLGVVYKPLHNPRANQHLREARQAVGMRTFSTRERTPREMIRHLRTGHALAILPDQDAGRRGVYLDFFGKPASMALGPASLAVRFNLPVLPVFCLRTAPCKIKAITGEPIWPILDAPDAEAETVRITELYNRQLEAMIRTAPEQYFWWHRRWKTRPRAKDRVYAGGQLQSRTTKPRSHAN